MSKPSPFWTPENLSRLQELAKAKLSATEIGAQMSVSRNSVVGKLSRLGIPLMSAEAASRRRYADYVPKPRPIHPPPPIPEDAQPSLNLGVEELSDKTCRWPYGDGNEQPYTFCGHPVDGFSPYCRAHRAKACDPRKLPPLR